MPRGEGGEEVTGGDGPETQAEEDAVRDLDNVGGEGDHEEETHLVRMGVN